MLGSPMSPQPLPGWRVVPITSLGAGDSFKLLWHKDRHDLTMEVPVPTGGCGVARSHSEGWGLYVDEADKVMIRLPQHQQR